MKREGSFLLSWVSLLTEHAALICSSIHHPSVQMIIMTKVKQVKLAILFVLLGVLITIVAVRYQDIKHNAMMQLGSTPMLHVEKTDGRTYLVDVTKEKFDVTAALEQGYKLDGFEFGIGKDTIAPIMKPEYVKPGDPEFESWPEDNAVLGTVIDDQARAYPIRLLSHHEVVNDEINDVSFAACYCPLADLGAVYKCETPKGDITIGTSGWTYNRTFMLYDHTTDSLWYPFENERRRTVIDRIQENILEAVERESSRDLALHWWHHTE